MIQSITDDKILKNNNKMGKIHLENYNHLAKKSKRLWNKHGQNNVIENPKIAKAVLDIQKEMDYENAQALKCFLGGRIVWQGFV